VIPVFNLQARDGIIELNKRLGDTDPIYRRLRGLERSIAMDENEKEHDQGAIWIRRIARIWSLPVILYSLVMFLGYLWSWLTTGIADPYAVDDVPLLEALPPILMFISVIGLMIAWKWERTGGLITLGFQVITFAILLVQRPIWGELSRWLIPYILSIIVAIPGILFLIADKRSRHVIAAGRVD
jgi:hypothetical protein